MLNQMPHRPSACQNPHTSREIRVSLKLTQSVCIHQRKKNVQNIYISCTSNPRCAETFPREMGHHNGDCNKICFNPVSATATGQTSGKCFLAALQHKINSWESTEGLGNAWEKPTFSWQRLSPAYRFRFSLPNMPRFPN